jgi:hypothetical protein
MKNNKEYIENIGFYFYNCSMHYGELSKEVNINCRITTWFNIEQKIISTIHMIRNNVIIRSIDYEHI